MLQHLKIFAVVVIIAVSYLGIRYIGSVIHYGCTAPDADGPPPLCLMGELGWVMTGGSLVPLWTRD